MEHSVWVNQDGHAYIAVRGTKLTSGKDLLQDAEILVSGTVPGQAAGARNPAHLA